MYLLCALCQHVCLMWPPHGCECMCVQACTCVGVCAGYMWSGYRLIACVCAVRMLACVHMVSIVHGCGCAQV